MTPPPMTSAGRRTAAEQKARHAPVRAEGFEQTGAPRAGRSSLKTSGSTRGASSAPSDHRRTLSRSSAQRSPRRVSGPLAGRAAALLGRVARAAPTRAAPTRAASTRTTSARTASERTASVRTARQRQRARPSAAKPVNASSIPARALAFLRSLPDHPLLDRIVRGRTWIALLGLMLAGIVAMQVEQLKLGASIGRSIERTSQLQTHNEQLQSSVASLSDEQRIERLAAAQGMIMPPPDAIGFLADNGQSDIGKALSNVHAPDPAAFGSLQAGSGAVVTSADINAITPSLSTATTTQAPGSAQTATTTQAPGSAQTATTTQPPTSTQAATTTQAPASPGTTPTTDQTAAASAPTPTAAPAAPAGAPTPATAQAATATSTQAPANAGTENTTQSAPSSGGLTPSGG
jgi:cell division protein FtsL